MEPMLSDDIIVTRSIQCFVACFIIFAVVAKILGPERKAKWFKRREKYTFFNRRGVFGEFMNYGYPRTWQGLILAIVMVGGMLAGSYWYVFIYK